MVTQILMESIIEREHTKECKMEYFGAQVRHHVVKTWCNSFLARGRFYSFRTTEMKIRPMTDKEQRDMEDRYKPHGGRPPAG